MARRTAKFLRVATLAIIAVCGLSIAACVPGPDTDSILKRGNHAEPESLDPQLARSESAGNVLRDLYEGLVTEAPDGSLEPGMAGRWEIEEGGRLYRFFLRGARWSDGEPVTAADFIRGLRRAVEPGRDVPYGGLLDVIENAERIRRGDLDIAMLGVKAPADNILEITLAYPVAYFPALMSMPVAFPLHLSAEGEALSPETLVSNGAYEIETWVPYAYVGLKKNPYYWRAGEVAIERVEHHVVPDEVAELSRFRAGELDITSTIPASRLEWIREHLADELKIAPVLNTYYYGLNLLTEPFANDLNLRTALSLVIDRELIAREILGAGEQPAYSLVPPGVSNYTPQEFEYATWPQKLKNAVAIRHLAISHYRRGDEPPRVELRYNTSGNHKRIAVAIASMWKDVLGIETELIGEEWKVLLANRRAREVTQVFRSGWIGDYDDPTTYLDLFRCDSPLNDTGFGCSGYDGLLAEAQLQTDPAKRRALLEKAERALLVEHPIIPIYFYVSRHLVSSRVEGWQSNVLDHHLSRHLMLNPEGG